MVGGVVKDWQLTSEIPTNGTSHLDHFAQQQVILYENDVFC